jgi:ribosome biogenesis GTPase
MSPTLAELGWDAAWSRAFEPYAGQELTPGRIAVQHRGQYDVLTAAGATRSRITSRLRRESDRAALPVVGDWVALDSSGSIVDVVTRRTTISRRAAHEPASGVSREQVIAANVDVVLVVHALGQELDRRLLERYLALAVESGAQPGLVLTKADLESDPAAVAAEIADIGDEVPIHLVSARTGLGLDAMGDVLGAGTTGVLLGPSGVGKSTLVNALIGDDSRLATGAVSADGEGRHTTTRRELVLLPSGGIIIDNPGMREVHLWIGDTSLADAFDDIAELAASCRFSDCRHETEPGCAVRAALETGELPRERWESYRVLEREVAELAERLEQRERSRARRGPSAGAS